MNPYKILPAVLCLIGLLTLPCHAQSFSYSSENPRSFDLKIDFVPNSTMVKFQLYKYSPNKLRLQLRDLRHMYIYDKPVSNYRISNYITLNFQDMEDGEYIIEIWEGRELVFTKSIIKEHLVLAKPLEVQNIMLADKKF